mmetsp:Transcript_21686/g.71791  ORF Transcript_21686/g.71791 Transcript_21686/m.71791 type:complete len:269 (+) Transcript_21686:52-858(+)
MWETHRFPRPLSSLRMSLYGASVSLYGASVQPRASRAGCQEAPSPSLAAAAAAAATSAAAASANDKDCVAVSAGLGALALGSGMLRPPPPVAGRFRPRGTKAVGGRDGGFGAAGAAASAGAGFGFSSSSSSEPESEPPARRRRSVPMTSAPPGPVTRTASSLPVLAATSTSNSTSSPSAQLRKPVLCSDRWWANMSPSPSERWMKPQPPLTFHRTTLPRSRSGLLPLFSSSNFFAQDGLTLGSASAPGPLVVGMCIALSSRRRAGANS